MSLPSVVIREVIEELEHTAKNSPPGNFIEVGVYKGGTASYLTRIAKEQNRKVFLYDTFEGIPFTSEDKKDFHKVGDFSDTDYETVKNSLPYATVVKGIFPSSAVSMSDIAFAHIDCDQYQSVFESVKYILPLMVKGGIIWFDDAPDLEGALLAVEDLFGKDNYEISKTGKIYKIVD